MKSITANNAPLAIGPYSHGYETESGIVFTSGQLGLDPVLGTLGEGIEAQAELSCKNVKAVLEAAGTRMDKVIKTTCYLANMSDFGVFNEIYGKYFTSKPARSCVAVKELPKGALCEIEAIAEK